MNDERQKPYVVIEARPSSQYKHLVVELTDTNISSHAEISAIDSHLREKGVYEALKTMSLARGERLELKLTIGDGDN